MILAIMKKCFYSLFAAVALMFAATSCSQDELVGNETSGDGMEVSFNLELEGEQASRAIGDGLTVDQLIFAVFDEQGAEIKNLRQEDVTVSNLGAVVKTHLVKGQTYQFVFWAQKKGTGHYDTGDMKAVKVNTDQVLNNDESRDAFYAYEGKTKVTGPFSKNIVLKRPFAQLNLGTSAEDLSWASNAGVTIAKTSVTVEGAVYTTLNTFDGTVADEQKAELELNLIPDKDSERLIINDSENQFDNDEYYYLSTSYLLAPADKTLSKEIIFTLKDANDKEINNLYVYNAPLQRNWRTNIVGDILTGEGTFNIVIDPIFDADRNYWMDGTVLDIWDGTVTANLVPNAAGQYEINSAADLLALSNVDVTGKTIVLNRDLSFKNVETRAGDTTPATIEPLFGKGNGAYNITFLGNDHVIRDFIIDGENELNSLFGGMVGGSISNLTIINAEVKGMSTADGRAAIAVAQTFGTVRFENVTIKDSKLQGVQKIGGLIGFVHENQVEVTNCTVDGLVLTSIDLSDETGATGGLIGHINSGNNKITNSYVKNSTITTIQGVNEAKRANGEFIGVIYNSNVEITNCGVANNQFTNSIEWTPYHNPFVGGNRGNATLIVNNDGTSNAHVSTVEGLKNALNNPDVDVVELTSKVESVGVGFEVRKDIVFNMNNQEFNAGSTSSSMWYAIEAYGNYEVVFNDANFTRAGIAALEGADVVFNSGLINHNPERTSRYIFCVGGEGSTVTINGGTFTNDRVKNSYFYAFDGGIIYVKGGTFNGVASNNNIVTATGGTVIITGGTFGFDPTKWVAEGYKAEKSGSTWTVSAE